MPFVCLQKMALARLRHNSFYSEAVISFHSETVTCQSAKDYVPASIALIIFFIFCRAVLMPLIECNWLECLSSKTTTILRVLGAPATHKVLSRPAKSEDSKLTSIEFQVTRSKQKKTSQSSEPMPIDRRPGHGKR